MGNAASVANILSESVEKGKNVGDVAADYMEADAQTRTVLEGVGSLWVMERELI